MSTKLSDLTTALLDTIAATPGLAGVRLANEATPPESAKLPAATLVLHDATLHEGIDRLTRVCFQLTVFRRDADPQANSLALAELVDAVVETVLADPSLGGAATPGPAGSSIEIARIAPAKSAAPMASLAINIACYAITPDGLTPVAAQQQVSINGQPMLASGPHWITVAEFQRRRIDRTFAGLSGVVSIDLGATSRPILLAGRLVADDPQALLDMMAALSALSATSALHTLSIGDGRLFPNVRLEQIRWGRLLSAGPDQRAVIAYEIQFSQLAE